MKRKLYDEIKNILTAFPETRDSDKKLIWTFWSENGYINSYSGISRTSFMDSPSTESIRRCRQKIQQLHLNLRPMSENVKKARHSIERQRGTHIFREQLCL